MKDVIVSIIGMLLGILIIILSRDLPTFIAKGYPGPSFFPLILSAISILCGFILMLKTFKSLKKQNKKLELVLSISQKGILNNIPLRNATIFAFFMVTYILLIPYLGFFLVSLMFMFITQTAYGVSVLKALAISSAAIFLIYMLFIVILKVVVPEPILGSLIFR